MPINKLISEHQRCAILRSLNEAPGMDLNDSILGDILAEYSLGCSRDQLHTQLSWLEQNGYITVEKIGNGHTWVSTITQAGIDVAAARIVVPGIKRPNPNKAKLL